MQNCSADMTCKPTPIKASHTSERNILSPQHKFNYQSPKNPRGTSAFQPTGNIYLSLNFYYSYSDSIIKH